MKKSFDQIDQSQLDFRKYLEINFYITNVEIQKYVPLCEIINKFKRISEV